MPNTEAIPSKEIETGIALVNVNTHLPIAWRATQSVELTMPRVDGVLLLRVLSLLESMPADSELENNPEVLRWQALEARVDLCLHMLCQLAATNTPMPKLCAVEFNGEQACWHHPQSLAVDEAGGLGLWLSPRIPQPLWLPATISECHPVAEVDGKVTDWLITARFQPLEETLQNAWDKTVFRFHRRAVFEQKHREAGS